MCTRVIPVAAVLLFLGWSTNPLAAAPVGTAVTYQGQLKQSGLPYSGAADLAFTLYDAAAGGNVVAGPVILSAASVVNGLFTVSMDFGVSAFDGNARWLEIAVRSPAGSGSYTPLSPRQELTGTPHALFALNADRLDGLDSTAFLQSIPVPLSLSGTSTTYIIRGENMSSLPGAVGLYGRAAQGTGLYGEHTDTTGIAPGIGGATFSASNNAAAITGKAWSATGNTVGVWGESVSSTGVVGHGPVTGVYGEANSPSGATYGGYFHSVSNVGRGATGAAVWLGLEGLATASSGDTTGIFGSSASTSGRGVYGEATSNTGNTYGVKGVSVSSSGTGVFGWATAASGVNYGIFGQSGSPSGYAGYFTGVGADALLVTNTGSGRGIQAIADSDTAVWATTTSGFAGLDARNADANGVGVYAEHSAWTGTAPAVKGVTYSRVSNAPAVLGVAAATATDSSTVGVWGESVSSTGVVGIGRLTGIYGEAMGNNVVGQEVYGGLFVARNSYGSAYGVLGDGGVNPGYAYGVYSIGDFAATGNKSFRIDHPLDPENKYLSHYCAEGPEPLLIYRGNVVLDAQGRAWVELPDYFEAINRDFHYQLTSIGGFAPIYIAEEISQNRFLIAGGRANMKVSWTVTGIRNDAWTRQRAHPVEQEKPAPERGKYQHPELYGQPPERGMNYHAAYQQLSAVTPDGTSR